jgi:hypothetical protein
VLEWNFDPSLTETTGTYVSVGTNNVSLSSSSVHGYGSSLALSSSSEQGVQVTSPFLPLYNRSWTFETWIYPTNTTGDRGIIGQCQVSSDRKCLHILIRGGKLFFSFYGELVNGNQLLNISTWYHAAFVCNCSNRNQRLYLDGQLEKQLNASSCYEGTSGTLTFGMELRTNFTRFFDGLIDQVIYTSRAKTDAEIRRDATLTFHLSFDNDSVDDTGPLSLQPTTIGTTSFVSGRVGRALSIGNQSHSYLLIRNLVLLGTSGRTYSIVLWIRPRRIDKATILHFSNSIDVTGAWCIAMLGLDSGGRVMAFSFSTTVLSLTGPVIPTNTWTHIGIVYSAVHGWELYVNGSVAQNASSHQYAGPGPSNYLFVGSTANVTSCATQGILDGQYDGDIDEFQLYSRRLAASEIVTLANP